MKYKILLGALGFFTVLPYLHGTAIGLPQGADNGDCPPRFSSSISKRVSHPISFPSDYSRSNPPSGTSEEPSTSGKSAKDGSGQGNDNLSGMDMDSRQSSHFSESISPRSRNWRIYEGEVLILSWGRGIRWEFNDETFELSLSELVKLMSLKKAGEEINGLSIVEPKVPLTLPKLTCSTGEESTGMPMLRVFNNTYGEISVLSNDPCRMAKTQEAEVQTDYLTPRSCSVISLHNNETDSPGLATLGASDTTSCEASLFRSPSSANDSSPLLGSSPVKLIPPISEGNPISSPRYQNTTTKTPNTRVSSPSKGRRCSGNQALDGCGIDRVLVPTPPKSALVQRGRPATASSRLNPAAVAAMRAASRRAIIYREATTK
jgi:hypothetical protein